MGNSAIIFGSTAMTSGIMMDLKLGDYWSFACQRTFMKTYDPKIRVVLFNASSTIVTKILIPAFRYCAMRLTDLQACVCHSIVQSNCEENLEPRSISTIMWDELTRQPKPAARVPPFVFPFPRPLRQMAIPSACRRCCYD